MAVVGILGHYRCVSLDISFFTSIHIRVYMYIALYVSGSQNEACGCSGQRYLSHGQN